MQPAAYDYIIAGAGSSGLSLAWHMIHSALEGQKMLVIDRNLTPENDKTWCFWSDDSHPFDHLIQKRWQQADVFILGDHYRGKLSEFPYHCIRSGDYRRAILDELDSVPNVTMIEAPIEELGGDDEQAWLQSNGDRYSAEYIFQSCFPPLRKRNPNYPMIQHFLGWEITANTNTFEPESFTFMDFDESYNDGIAFMYVLPWSGNRALLEYTIFSKTIEEITEYEKKLELYLYNKYNLLRIDYSIDRTEYGNIPMEDSVYHPWYAPRVLTLGMHGGLTKPSTGYTYRRIQNHSKEIVESLVETGRPREAPRPALRFRSYDLWLLEIMHDYPDDALQIFHSLFRNNSFDAIFRFLGEESDWGDDFKIMSSVPYKPFFRAMWKTKKRMLNF